MHDIWLYFSSSPFLVRLLQKHVDTVYLVNATPPIVEGGSFFVNCTVFLSMC